jgi:hypothetical protein
VERELIMETLLEVRNILEKASLDPKFVPGTDESVLYVVRETETYRNPQGGDFVAVFLQLIRKNILKTWCPEAFKVPEGKLNQAAALLIGYDDWLTRWSLDRADGEMYPGVMTLITERALSDFQIYKSIGCVKQSLEDHYTELSGLCAEPDEADGEREEAPRVLADKSQADAATFDYSSHRGDLVLNHLTSANMLKLPQGLDGHLGLNGLTSADGLVLPERLDGYLRLGGLTSAEGLVLPEHVGSDLGLDGLTSAEGLKLPERLDGGLYLNGLTSAEGLKLPERLDGGLYLNGLTSAEGLKLPERLDGGLSLGGLASAKGLALPKHVGLNLRLNGLTSAEGLKLPERLDGGLSLDGLTSAKGLALPEKIGGALSLKGLMTTEGLVLPKEIGGKVLLAEGLELPEKMPEIVGGVVNIEGKIVDPASLSSASKAIGIDDLEKVLAEAGFDFSQIDLTAAAGIHSGKGLLTVNSTDHYTAPGEQGLSAQLIVYPILDGRVVRIACADAFFVWDGHRQASPERLMAIAEAQSTRRLVKAEYKPSHGSITVSVNQPLGFDGAFRSSQFARCVGEIVGFLDDIAVRMGEVDARLQ